MYFSRVTEQQHLVQGRVPLAPGPTVMLMHTFYADVICGMMRRPICMISTS